MADGSTRAKSRKGWTVLWFGLGFGLLFVTHAIGLRGTLGSLVWGLSDDPETKLALGRLYWLVSQFVSVAYTTTLVTSAVGAVVGAVARTLIRARVRAGLPDPLDHLRRFTSGRPRLANGLLAVLPIAYAGLLVRFFTAVIDDKGWDSVLAGVALPALFTILAQLVIARRGLGALLAPTLSEEETTGAVTADGFTFTAVAVTTETIAAVGGLAAVSVVMVTLAMLLPRVGPAFATALLAYLALAVGGTALFRRASRISVGLDGIHVSGSARERFIPFREIDRARVNGQTIELVRGEHIVLRLQLHGADAIRRAPLAARINAAIEVAVAQRNEPAVVFVSSASSEAVGRAAGGASTYREAPPPREKLWQVLESPAVDAAGRKAAATALARDGDGAERARLRVAAEQCAEPSVRARLEELLAAEEEDAEGAGAPMRALKIRRA